MAAPKGNKNAVGNSGGKKKRSGRKTVIVEFANAQRLWRIWTEMKDKQEIENKLRSGKYSLEEIHAIKAFGGDITALNKYFDKLYPNLNNLSGDLGLTTKKVSDILNDNPAKTDRKSSADREQAKKDSQV
jgi:hypothetical protein